MREISEAGYVSLVELERGKKILHATLHNQLIDVREPKHRDVVLAWLVRPTRRTADWECYSLKSCPEYVYWSDVYLYELDVTENGTVLRVIA